MLLDIKVDKAANQLSRNSETENYFALLLSSAPLSALFFSLSIIGGREGEREKYSLPSCREPALPRCPILNQKLTEAAPINFQGQFKINSERQGEEWLEVFMMDGCQGRNYYSISSLFVLLFFEYFNI